MAASAPAAAAAHTDIETCQVPSSTPDFAMPVEKDTATAPMTSAAAAAPEAGQSAEAAAPAAAPAQHCHDDLLADSSSAMASPPSAVESDVGEDMDMDLNKSAPGAADTEAVAQPSPSSPETPVDDPGLATPIGEAPSVVESEPQALPAQDEAMEEHQEASMDAATAEKRPASEHYDDAATAADEQASKRARTSLPPPRMTLEEAGKRLLAAAEMARGALPEEPTATGGGERADLEAACRDAQEKLREAEVQRRAEEASLIAAKARLLSLQAAVERAAYQRQQTQPFMEKLQAVAAEVSEACRSTANAAGAVSAAEGAGALMEEASAVGEPCVEAAFGRLGEAQSRAALLAEEHSAAEAARGEAEAQVAELELERERAGRKAAAEAAAAEVVEVSERLQKDAEALEAELAILEAAAVAVSAQEQAPSVEQEAAADTAPDAAVGSSGADSQKAECLRSLEKRAEELQRACEEQGEAIADLEARCASVGGADAGSAPPAAKADEAKAEQPKLDLAKPGAYLVARAAQRLVVSTEDAPDVAGEYRLLPGAANGCPAYKASLAGQRAAFLLWTPCEGGCWVFAPDLDGTGVVLARSLQLAWTALPDEIMASSWTRAAWGERGGRVRIAVLRG